MKSFKQYLYEKLSKPGDVNSEDSGEDVETQSQGYDESEREAEYEKQKQKAVNKKQEPGMQPAPPTQM